MQPYNIQIFNLPTNCQSNWNANFVCVSFVTLQKSTKFVQKWLMSQFSKRKRIAFHLFRMGNNKLCPISLQSIDLHFFSNTESDFMRSISDYSEFSFHFFSHRNGNAFCCCSFNANLFRCIIVEMWLFQVSMDFCLFT